MVTKEPRTNARFVAGFNANDYPIMEIYPSDVSDVSDRVQFIYKEVVGCDPDKVRADGGGYFWLLNDDEHREDCDLFLRDEDVEKYG